jgi:hypothetical protein
MKHRIGTWLIPVSLLGLLVWGVWGDEGGDRPLPCHAVES